MEGIITSDAAQKAYKRFLRARLRGRLKMYISAVLLLAFTIVMWYQQYVGFEHGHVGIQLEGYRTSERMFYELPLIWLTILVVQILLYHAARIPGLRKWQDKLERKEFEQLKNSYEYQQKL